MQVIVIERHSHTGVWEEASAKESSWESAEVPPRGVSMVGLEKKGQMCRHF